MAYGGKFIDYGQTCEPCPMPDCNRNLRWSREKAGAQKIMILKCPDNKCGFLFPPSGASEVKGVTPFVGQPLVV
mgnify:FL=1